MKIPLPAISAVLMMVMTILAAEAIPVDEEPMSIDLLLARKRNMSAAEKIRAKRLNIHLYGDVVQEVVRRMNEPLRGTESEARVVRVQRDNIGYTHVRLKQYYNGIPVHGADMIVHVNKKKILYDIDGSISPKLSVDISTKLSAKDAEEIALNDARNTICTDDHCQNWKRVTSTQQDSVDKLIAKGSAECRLMHVPSKIITGGTVAYVVEVCERGIDYANWEYWINGNSGEIIQKHNTIHYANPPSSQGYHTTITGVKLKREVNPSLNDSVVTITGWKDTVGDKRYFLYFKGDSAKRLGAWGVYDSKAGEWEQLDSANWATTDRAAISAAKTQNRLCDGYLIHLDYLGLMTLGEV